MFRQGPVYGDPAALVGAMVDVDESLAGDAQGAPSKLRCDLETLDLGDARYRPALSLATEAAEPSFLTNPREFADRFGLRNPDRQIDIAPPSRGQRKST